MWTEYGAGCVGPRGGRCGIWVGLWRWLGWWVGTCVPWRGRGCRRGPWCGGRRRRRLRSCGGAGEGVGWLEAARSAGMGPILGAGRAQGQASGRVRCGGSRTTHLAAVPALRPRGPARCWRKAATASMSLQTLLGAGLAWVEVGLAGPGPLPEGEGERCRRRQAATLRDEFGQNGQILGVAIACAVADGAPSAVRVPASRVERSGLGEVADELRELGLQHATARPRGARSPDLR